MNAITREPARLQAEERRIERGIVDAAVEQYPAFLAIVDAGDAALSRLNRAQGAAARLAASLSALHAKSAALMPVGAEWRQQKQCAATALTDHPRIAELLEMPATLDACARHELFHEALLVLEHATTVAEQLGDTVLVRRLCEDVAAAMERIVRNLVDVKLLGPLALSQAIKIVSFLRKLGFTDAELRALFLEKRSAFVESLVAELDPGLSPYLLISKHLAILKLNVTEVVAHFRAVFPSDGLPQTMSDELSEWGIVQTGKFLDVFRRLLPLVGASEIGLLAEHSAHCCAALAKVSLDVHVTVNALITERVGEIIRTNIDAARTAIRAAMDAHVWRPVHIAGSHRDGSSAAGDGAQPGSALMPPLRLLQFLPLAYTVNSIANICNDLRRAAVVAAAAPLRDGVLVLLEDLVAFITDAEGKVLETDEPALEAFAAALVGDAAPFITRCVNSVFPASVTFADVSRVVAPAEKLVSTTAAASAAAAPASDASLPVPPAAAAAAHSCGEPTALDKGTAENQPTNAAVTAPSGLETNEPKLALLQD